MPLGKSGEMGCKTASSNRVDVHRHLLCPVWASSSPATLRLGLTNRNALAQYPLASDFFGLQEKLFADQVLGMGNTILLVNGSTAVLLYKRL